MNKEYTIKGENLQLEYNEVNGNPQYIITDLKQEFPRDISKVSISATDEKSIRLFKEILGIYQAWKEIWSKYDKFDILTCAITKNHACEVCKIDRYDPLFNYAWLKFPTARIREDFYQIFEPKLKEISIYL
jgi:hypothetical protein